MRNNLWLQHRLRYIWQRHFNDKQQINPIAIKFGRNSYQRLGSISLKNKLSTLGSEKYSSITISALLREESVPTIIIDQVIAHELVHYIHGFGSLYPRHLRHPHQGGVIVKEFKTRGLWELYRAYQAWMKLHWQKFIRQKLSS